MVFLQTARVTTPAAFVVTRSNENPAEDWRTKDAWEKTVDFPDKNLK